MATHITADHWMTIAQDRQQWRQAIHKGKSHTEENIPLKYQHDNNLRHGFFFRVPPSFNTLKIQAGEQELF